MDIETLSILTFLEGEGMAKGGNISPLLQSIFGHCPDTAEQVKYEANRTIDFLGRLEHQGIIVVNGNPAFSLGGLTDGGYRWFDTLTIWAHISLEGLNWLSNQRQQNAEERLRNSVITTNVATMINIGITILLAGFLAFLQYKTNERERSRENREIQQAREARQELERRIEWERRLQMSVDQLNLSVLRSDTNVKRVKIVSAPK